MRGEEPSRIHHVPLGHHIVKRFDAVLHPPFHVVLFQDVAALERRADHPRPQLIATVLQEATDTKRLAFVEGVPARVALQFAEEVLAEDIEGLSFGRLEDRLDEPDARLFGAPFCRQGAEPRLVAGLLTSVIVHCQPGCLVHCADVGFAGRRQEAVVVSAVDAQGLQFPGAVPVWVPCEVALAIEVGGGVFASLV